MSGLSVGAGIVWGSAKLDYAFVPYGDLGNTHRISLGYRFGSYKSERYKAQLHYKRARKLYGKEMYVDALKVLEPYTELPAKSPKAARLAQFIKKKVAKSFDPDMLYNQASVFYKRGKFINAHGSADKKDGAEADGAGEAGAQDKEV